MTAPETALQMSEPAVEPDRRPAPCTVTEPARQLVPLVFSSPHSGRYYPPQFVAESCLDELTLRASEDYYVDELFGAAPTRGAPLLQANYARAYVDVNREPWELDPGMFDEPLPDYVNSRSGRVAAGLGTIARVVASGTNIYDGKLPFADARNRIERIYRPYHAKLRALMDTTHERFNTAILVDCHSMPSAGTSFGDMPLRNKSITADFILGNRYGRSCKPELIEVAEHSLVQHGYNVVRNDPYSGGYNTRQYSEHGVNRQALQIEINRGIYIDETTLERTAGYEALKDHLTQLIDDLSVLLKSDQ